MKYSQSELEIRMNTRWAGHPVTCYEVLGSTNIQAKLDAEGGAGHGSLIVADMQTAGRGRRGRTWSSPADTNVYFTLILKPELEPDKASMLTPIMAMAVVEGIRTACGAAAQIKWPNDVVMDGKKVCGILTEMSAEAGAVRYIVIGVGINVGLQEFPSEVAPVATCLQKECGESISRTELLVNVLRAFEEYYEIFMERKNLSGLMEEYNRLLVNRGRQVQVLDPAGAYQGVSGGINESGELLVETPDGRLVQVYAGEVSVRGIYGYV